MGAAYWKPVQSGTADGDDDTRDVGRWAGLAPSRLHPPRYSLGAPLAPDQAAALEGLRLNLADFALPPGPGPLVVEGAGGLLVPLNERETLADLFAVWGLPLVVVGASGLGTINHTLLTLEAAQRRSLRVAGVLLSGPHIPKTGVP
ncbi:dethiobiotin synthase [Deinococcus lacus]|uniref:Dethiobiotin synthase n=1 Tax=Deinococcus lacus TaxID=392561 RepID=A0ABW1YEH8_9DEIO